MTKRKEQIMATNNPILEQAKMRVRIRISQMLKLYTRHPATPDNVASPPTIWVSNVEELANGNVRVTIEAPKEELEDYARANSARAKDVLKDITTFLAEQDAEMNNPTPTGR